MLDIDRGTPRSVTPESPDPSPTQEIAVEAHPMTRRLAAEFLGTFVLVLGGCGAAVLAAGVPDVGIGFLGVALAFGLTVLVMAYAVGHVSGGHFNPAVTLGLAVGGRFRWSDVLPYVVTQVVAAVVASAVLFVVADGRDGFSATDSGFATNGYGDRSPEGYSLLAVVVIEVVLTAVFLYVILGATDTRAPKGFAPLAIGLSLTLIHLVSIPVSNTSVNPARSTGPALFAGSDALAQLWVFWAAPLVGAAIAGATYAFLLGKDDSVAPLTEATEA
jgi:aquaporin Z